MIRTKVDRLEIVSFRRFQDIEIEFGEHVTLIAGQNGTSKSTLLGMLAQPFSFGVVRGKTAGDADKSSYTDNYHGLKLNEFADFTGRHFMYDCDNVFRLSAEFDYGKNYEYRTRLSLPTSNQGELPDSSLTTKSRNRTAGKRITGMRFVTGPGASHESGEGNFPHPVIYLGLNRLWPLAAARKCEFSADILASEDRDWYVDKYSEILCLNEPQNGAKFMSTLEKRKFITPHGQDYDGESCSAGQDNLSQILTAILSFRRLEEKLQHKYQGGMLLIDELDAALHPYAQHKLLELLCSESRKLRLQVVATTHSLRMIESKYQSSISNSIELMYFENRDGQIFPRLFSNYQDISDHLRVEVTRRKKSPQKVSAILEDKEAEYLFWKILGSKFRKFVVCANTSSLGADKLKSLSDISRSLPDLQRAIFVPDGDVAHQWKKDSANVLALPGDVRIETLIYRHLFELTESDPFWRKCGESYTRQFAIVSQGGKTLETGNDKDWVKKWYRTQSQYWGRSNSTVLDSWVEANKSDCLGFCNKFLKLLAAQYRGDLPIELLKSSFKRHE